MDTVVSRWRARVAAADGVTPYARGGVLALLLFGLAAVQWRAFDRRSEFDPVEPTLELLVVVAAVSGFVAFDFLRSSPDIYRPLAVGLALVGVSGTVDLMDDLVHQPVGFSLAFESLTFVVAVGAFLVAVGRWADERDEREATLRRRNERLDTFASVASHDLRNPLQVARGNLDAVRRRDDPEAIDRLERAIDRMDAIVDDALQFSRIGPEYVDPEPVTLAAVADAAWDAVHAESAKLVVEADADLTADPGMVQQALENLFRNAVEHGGSDVTVWVGATTKGFYVTDDGPGIDGDERDDVFESGYSASDGGTGFGLAIVQRIVEAHGWSIRTVTGHDGGARFEIVTE